MSNGDVKSHVTSVHLLDDDTVQVNVLFDGFKPGEPVEITGYVTQTDGAYVSFYLYTTAPTPTPPNTWVTVPVTTDEKLAGVRHSDRMTVVTKVAKVWPTVLASKPEGTTTTGPGSGDRIPPNAVATWTALPPPAGGNW
jgi:hypothetical protein